MIIFEPARGKVTYCMSRRAQNRTEHTLYFCQVIHNMTCEVQTNKQMSVAATKYQI